MVFIGMELTAESMLDINPLRGRGFWNLVFISNRCWWIVFLVSHVDINGFYLKTPLMIFHRSHRQRIEIYWIHQDITLG